jgi:hypothetical protein
LLLLLKKINKFLAVYDDNVLILSLLRIGQIIL